MKTKLKKAYKIDLSQKTGPAFIAALNRAIEFHRTNQNDPHNIGVAVMVTLTEVRDAMRYALNN
jgi:hypothetical protein